MVFGTLGFLLHPDLPSVKAGFRSRSSLEVLALLSWSCTLYFRLPLPVKEKAHQVHLTNDRRGMADRIGLDR